VANQGLLDPKEKRGLQALEGTEVNLGQVVKQDLQEQLGTQAQLDQLGQLDQEVHQVLMEHLAQRDQKD
jgi:hypothetical protein